MDRRTGGEHEVVGLEDVARLEGYAAPVDREGAIAEEAAVGEQVLVGIEDPLQPRRVDEGAPGGDVVDERLGGVNEGDVGDAIGAAGLSTIFASAVNSYLHSHTPSPQLTSAAAVHGYTTAFWVAAAIFTAGAILVGSLVPSIKPRATTPKPTPARAQPQPRAPPKPKAPAHPKNAHTMTHQSSLVHRHVSRSGPRQANGDAQPSSPGAVGARRWSVKVANPIASHYGFAISRKPSRHD
jgi:hypothetical protein